MPPQDQNPQNNTDDNTEIRPEHVDPFSAAPHLTPDEVMLQQFGQQPPANQEPAAYTSSPQASLQPFSQPEQSQQPRPPQPPQPPTPPRQYPQYPAAPAMPPQPNPAQPQYQQNYQPQYPQRPQFPSSQTPPAPLGGYQNQTAYQQYQVPKSGKKIFLMAGVAVGVILLLGAGAFAYMSTKATPDSVFAGAVENSLSTRQVKQTTVADKSTMTYLYDISDAKAPRVYTETTANIFGVNVAMKQYATVKNSFVNYNSFGTLFSASSPANPYKDKWMQSRVNGVTQGEAGGLGTLLGDAYYSLFGDWIFGNFSAADRAALKKIIIDEKVYTYDASKVQKKTVSGQEVYAYSVTENTDALIKLNKKAAQIWGADPEGIAGYLKGALQKGAKATMYLNIKTKELVQVEADFGGTKAVNKYTDYNNVKLPTQPKVEADYQKFNDAVNQAPSFF